LSKIDLGKTISKVVNNKSIHLQIANNILLKIVIFGDWRDNLIDGIWWLV